MSLCYGNVACCHLLLLQWHRPKVLRTYLKYTTVLGPVHMEASQPAYRARDFCRDLTSSPIPIQNLISVHMTRRAGLLSEISLVYWRDLGRRDENFSHMNTPSRLPR